ncbi:MAG TPA: 6-bladed beta-propeller [Aggregatilineales bacterium]|nr:6-bladed beta-propeller [Aggregatilineales bacterium]
MKCSYCGNVAIVPQNLRAKQPDVQPMLVVKMPTGMYSQQAIFQQTRDIQRSANRMAVGITAVVLAVVLVSVVGSIALFANIGTTVTSSFSSAASAFRENTSSALQRNTSSKSSSQASNVGFATLSMTVGDKGTGLGLLDDARGVAVDADGNIYTSEYMSGRIQKFDPSGKFLKTWTPDGKTPLLSLAADLTGNLWAVRDGVYHYNTSGELLGKLPGSDDVFIESVAVRPDGDLEAFSSASGDDLIRLSPHGIVVSRIHNAISTQTENDELDMRMAVDGTGNIFAMGSFNNAVFKFTKDGNFVNKFGEEGDQPGQFRAMNAIAVDGQGRVYVADIKGVQVFTGDGRYLDVIPVPNYVAFGLAFDSKNNLYVAGRDHIYKFTINDTATK